MSKICKKGYMGMRKWIHLETLKSVLGRSILHCFSEYIHTLMISETKLDDTFPLALYHLKDFSNPYILDRNSHGGRILVYLRDNIPSNLVKLDQKFQNFEGFFIELELSNKSKWLLSYHQQHLSNISKGFAHWVVDFN